MELSEAQERLEGTPCPNEALLLRTRLNTIRYELIPFLIEKEPLVNPLNVKYMLEELHRDIQRDALHYDKNELIRAIEYIKELNEMIKNNN
jgi:hypothetical protein